MFHGISLATGRPDPWQFLDPFVQGSGVDDAPLSFFVPFRDASRPFANLVVFAFFILCCHQIKHEEVKSVL